MLLMAVRSICKVGPEELFRLFKDAELFQPRKKPFGVQADCKYESTSYAAVYNLMSNSNKLDEEARWKNAVVTVTLASVLEKKTSFFDGIPKDLVSDFKNFVAALILRHKEALTSNIIELCGLQGWEGITPASFYKYGKRNFARKVDDTENVPYGVGIYPTAALINHSCDPNVIKMTHPTNGTLMIMTKRSMKAGEPVLRQYSRSFGFQPLFRRQKILKGCYHFTCQCVACKNRWPTLDELRVRAPKFCCPTCSQKFTYVDKCDSNKFGKCLLQSPDWTCGMCKMQYSGRVLQEQLSKYQGLYDKNIDELAKINRPFVALEKLQEAINFMETHCCPPYATWYRYTELVKYLFCIITFTSQA